MHKYDFQRGIISGIQATTALEHEPASKAICKLATALLELFDDGDVSCAESSKLFLLFERLVAKVEGIDPRLKKIEHLLVNRS